MQHPERFGNPEDGNQQPRPADQTDHDADADHERPEDTQPKERIRQVEPTKLAVIVVVIVVARRRHSALLGEVTPPSWFVGDRVWIARADSVRTGKIEGLPDHSGSP